MLDIGLPSFRIGGTDFFLSGRFFSIRRSALISKQSKQSGLLSLAFPSYPRPIPNPLSPVFTFMRVSRFYSQIANGDGAILTSSFLFSTSSYMCLATKIFMLFLSYTSLAGRTILLLETGTFAFSRHILKTLIT